MGESYYSFRKVKVTKTNICIIGIGRIAVMRIENAADIARRGREGCHAHTDAI